MKSSDIFKLFELTRSMPQTGYVSNGLKQNELSNLAEHHYCVSIIAWYISRLLINKNINVDIGKVLELTLLHDVGELFGGDIGLTYRKANPEALALAKKFESSNQTFIASLFQNDKEHVQEIFNNERNLDSLEAIIAKTADYLEVTHFKLYLNNFSEKDMDLVLSTILKRISMVPDLKAREILENFINDWKKNIPGKTIEEVLNEMNS